MSGEAALAELEAGDAELGAALFAAVREPWLARALLAYYTRTGSARALALLAAAPEPHARHLLDALADLPPRAALAALAPLLAARPTWLPRLVTHGLVRDLLSAAARAGSPADMLHALLALAALAAAAPAAAPPTDVLPALLRAAVIPAPPAARAHLRLAQRALFAALYAAQPAALLAALRAELNSAAPAARANVAASLRPLLASVRLHPALVLAESPAPREPLDLLEISERLELPEAPLQRAAVPPPPPAPPPPRPPPPGSAEAASLAALAAAAEGRAGALADLCGELSAPATPLPAEEDPGEPPEAAVEATPENTPVGEARAAFRFPTESAAVRALGRASQPSSPLRKEASPPAGVLAGASEAVLARLGRVAADRQAADRRAAMSPVTFGGTAPDGVARPQPRPGAMLPPGVRSGSPPRQRPVAALATVPRAGSPEELLEAPRPVRRALPSRAPRTGRVQRERAASCPPTARRASVAVQTDDTWPEPVELILEDYYKSMLTDPPDEEGDEVVRPSEQLDRYLTQLYEGAAPAAAALPDALRLTHAALQYERWRRLAHAERNRRLLGRVRAARSDCLAAAATQDRLRAALRERDLLRARRPPPAAPPPALAVQLQEEKDARLAAEAALLDARDELASTRAELERSRADALDATRTADSLARAAAAAERRADTVRRLRHELLLATEREARLIAVAREPPAPPPPDPALHALRTTLTRAESELDAATLRADAATARAADLEAQLAAKDAALAELRRATRAAAEDAAARARASDERLAALRSAARAAARVALAPRPAPAALPPAASLLAPDIADEPLDFAADWDA